MVRFLQLTPETLRELFIINEAQYASLRHYLDGEVNSDIEDSEEPNQEENQLEEHQEPGLKYF